MTKTEIDAAIESIDRNEDFYARMAAEYPQSLPFGAMHSRIVDVKRLLDAITKFITTTWDRKSTYLVKDSFRKNQFYKTYENKPALKGLLELLGLTKDSKVFNLAK